MNARPGAPIEDRAPGRSLRGAAARAVTAPVDDVARSEALLAARSETPNVMGTTYGALPGFPPSTVRLILVWGADALPTAIPLA